MAFSYCSPICPHIYFMSSWVQQALGRWLSHSFYPVCEPFVFLAWSFPVVTVTGRMSKGLSDTSEQEQPVLQCGHGSWVTQKRDVLVSCVPDLLNERQQLVKMSLKSVSPSGPPGTGVSTHSLKDTLYVVMVARPASCAHSLPMPL